MVINLEVPVGAVDKYTVYSAAEGVLKGFPLLSVDRGSYLVGGQLQSGLNLGRGGQVHSLQIGKYSALADGITFLIDLDHDYRSISMGLVPEWQEATKENKEMKIHRKGQILIQNDCWVGHGATLLGGVVIHDGAVVAAEAVVTKDVPPYAIVAGNPARVVKYRFPEEIRQALQKIAWWDWSSEKLRQNRRSMQEGMEAFVGEFLPEAESRLERICKHANPICALTEQGKIYVVAADTEESWPVCPGVIREFCEQFQRMDGQLVIYIPSICENKEKVFSEVMDILTPYREADCAVQIIDQEGVTAEDVIRNADAYITNRGSYNITYTCLADLYGKSILSGVDKKVF